MPSFYISVPVTVSPKSVITFKDSVSALFLSFSLSYPTLVVHDLVEHVAGHVLRNLCRLLFLVLRVVGAHPIAGANGDRYV